MWDLLLDSFLVTIEPGHLALIFVGAALGIMFGAIPGMTAPLGIALLVPLTFDMTPTASLIMLGAVYCGAIYGGSISAILLNVPGTPAAVATMIDGYRMTLKGRSGEALGSAVGASMLGGQVGVLVLLFGAPLIADWALSIRSAEFFWIVVFAMTTIGTLGEGSVVKNLISGIFGLILGLVGTFAFTGTMRYTFGLGGLYDGLPVVVALIGLFSISEILSLSERCDRQKISDTRQIGSMWPGFVNVVRYKTAAIRSSVMGTFIGVLPGAGADIASFMARTEAMRFSKKPEEFGKGAPESVVATESANNAVVGGSMIPMLTLGIPGNATTAALLAGLLIHGLVPSPRLFTEQAATLYPFVVSLFLSNFAFLILAVLGLRYIALVVRVPHTILAPAIAVFAVIGAYSYRNLVFDVWLMLALGGFGYMLRRAGFPLAPIILGIILGPLAEKNLVRTMTLADARGISVWEYFVSSPVCLVFIVLALLSILYSGYREIKRNRSVQALA